MVVDTSVYQGSIKYLLVILAKHDYMCGLVHLLPCFGRFVYLINGDYPFFVGLKCLRLMLFTSAIARN